MESDSKAHKPDDKVKKILEALSNGMTKAALAKKLGYKSYKSLDIYMKRKNYVFDSRQNNYIPFSDKLKEKKDIEITNVNYRANKIIELFKTPDADPRTIAKQMNFQNHNDMAGYMKTQGYIWDNKAGNYTAKIIESPAEADTKNAIEADELIKLLTENCDRVMELIGLGKSSQKVPRYIMPGIFITKSVHMSNTLDMLIKEYSKEKNISQREIFEVAIIDFFLKYGYSNEIEALLKM